MNGKKTLRDEVELALVALHKKIDSLRAKVDQLCESTDSCHAEPPKVAQRKTEKK
jgi:hypothetical protein